MKIQKNLKNDFFFQQAKMELIDQKEWFISHKACKKKSIQSLFKIRSPKIQKKKKKDNIRTRRETTKLQQNSHAKKRMSPPVMITEGTG